MSRLRFITSFSRHSRDLVSASASVTTAGLDAHTIRGTDFSLLQFMTGSALVTGNFRIDRRGQSVNIELVVQSYIVWCAPKATTSLASVHGSFMYPRSRPNECQSTKHPPFILLSAVVMCSIAVEASCHVMLRDNLYFKSQTSRNQSDL